MGVSQGSQQLIPLTMGQVTDSKIVSITQEMLPALIFGVGLTSTDSIPIKIATDSFGANKEAWFQDGSAVVLTPTNKGEAINTPMTIVIDKPATAAAVGIFLNQGLHC